ncbi:hypothetical protein HJC23_001461 [Cyclotella cryptica]|uniref:Uncharacterized protein n=1 Tax=Cyclotella cryptica TaxID=29204 RepID=A0ABD3PAK8_9STRA|eukprot:CCRYP_016158-RA/>CCRYP_016158-RA protein AED:0.16 eAED:0.16 QI:0/-1/0/1/-1/1/1/0/403
MLCPPSTTRSPIDLFLDKLPATIIQEIIGSDCDSLQRRRSLVTKGEEALRILKARKAVLAKKESPITRAGLVVDYLCRQGQNDGSTCYLRTSIPATVLLHALNIKGKKHVEQMQAMVSSHLEASSQKNSTQPTHKRKWNSYDHPAPDSRNISSNGPTASFPSTDLIRDLSIRLGPMIPNAELAASYAHQVFRALISYSNHSAFTGGPDSKHRHMLMSDVSRNVKYYEAACFFLAVQKIEGSTHPTSKRATKTNPSKISAKPSSTMEESDADNSYEQVDTDEDVTLHEMDIIKAANLREGMFNEVIECVKSYIQDIDVSLSTCKPDNLVSSLPEGSSANAPMASKKQPVNEKYEKWKHDVLEKAKVAARRMLQNERSVITSDFDDKELLQAAADEIFRKIGQLS